MTFLDDLDPEQRAAALAVRGPVCIVAGAGTGKTRTVTYRIAHAVISGAVDPRTALAITHSRKAATELADRLGKLGVGSVEARTFHAAGLRIAGQFWPRSGRPGASPQVARDTWGLWRDALRAVATGQPDQTAVREVVEEVAWARSRLVAIDDYETAAAKADRHPAVAAATVVAAWTAFSHLKSQRGVVDFADLLEVAAELLLGDAEVAERVRRRWAYVTVDEYQDTDPAQQHLLDAVLGGRDDVCVVGDPRQAIYSWKGAEPTYLNDFARHHPGAQVFQLTRNYRSTPQILDWANRIAADGRTRPLIATCPAGPAPRVRRFTDEGAETAWVVAQAARAMAAGTPASEVAVLYRFNSIQARFEAAFAQSDIAAVAAEDTTFFERAEVMAVLAGVRQGGADQPGLALLESVLAGAGFDRDAPPPGQGAARARWETHQALLELVTAWPEASRADAATMLAWLDGMAGRTHVSRGAGVTLATMHRAKGLEWDVVFIVAANDGAIPASYAITPDSEAEEERLLHVAMTRARRDLYITWPGTSPRGWPNRPCPYLDQFSRRSGDAQPARPRSPAPAKPVSRGEHRQAGAECPHCTEPLRGLAARRLGVCAHCVTHAPGLTGRRAAAVTEVVDQAAAALNQPAELLVTPAGLLRLLDQRPSTAEQICATPGVSLPRAWASSVADALVD